MLAWSGLIKKVRFPRQLVAFSVVATQLVTFAVMLAILIVLSLAHGARGARHGLARAPARRRSSPRLVFGLGLLVASLNVLFRDVEHILEAVLLPWFFLTPILYQLESIDRLQRSPHARRGAALGELRDAADLRDPLGGLGAAPAGRGRPDLPRVAAALALALGAFVFSRVDDRIAVEL